MLQAELVKILKFGSSRLLLQHILESDVDPNMRLKTFVLAPHTHQVSTYSASMIARPSLKNA